MGNTRFVVALVVWAGLGLGSLAAAQTTAAPLTIHNVTLRGDAGSGVLTITGTGFGREPVVTVDGQPVTVLLGGTETQIEVLATAALLTTPGTYRLTVMDTVRQVGDVFVVASQAATVAVSSAAPNASSTPSTPIAPPPAGAAVTGPVVTVAPQSSEGPRPTLIENPGAPYNAAIGFQALSSNTLGGGWNTASGYQALFSNTTGTENTASGYRALYSNTTGSANTASGVAALYSNTTGRFNTASGFEALYANTTGFQNTASGFQALNFNTTGFQNTASGYQALYANTTGFQNTASGFQALYFNTTGANNLASGFKALYANTTGYDNTASGFQALFPNTTGSDNTAHGLEALFNNTTGNANTASGAYSLNSNMSGNDNAAVGFNAGYNATTGSYNLFLGAEVVGTTADTNTIRIGLPYSGGVGQNRTFIAGIYGTQVTGFRQVVIDANGQLGTITPQSGGGTPVPMVGSLSSPTLDAATTGMAPVTAIDRLQQQVQELQTVNADLRARLARLEGLLIPAAGTPTHTTEGLAGVPAVPQE